MSAMSQRHRRLHSITAKYQNNFQYLQTFIIILFSAHFWSRTITTNYHLDNSRPFSSQNFSNYSLLTTNGSGPPCQSKMNLFSFRPKLSSKFQNSKNLLNLILILSGNIETNPGPNPSFPEFPCGTCHKDCPWGSEAIQCDGCDTWYHQQCVSMQTHIYVYYGNHSDSWDCHNCGLPNLSTRLLNSNSDLSSSSSSFEPDRPFQNKTSSPQLPPQRRPTPVQASTPKLRSTGTHPKSKANSILGLNTLVINFQSLWNKRVELSNLADDTKSDIIIGTETWLIPEKQPNGHKNSELLLDGYDISRRDRPTTGGGVLIAIKKELCPEEIHISRDSESIFCKIKLSGRRPLIIGSVYRPPNYDLDDSRKVASEIYKIVHEN